MIVPGTEISWAVLLFARGLHRLGTTRCTGPDLFPFFCVAGLSIHPKKTFVFSPGALKNRESLCTGNNGKRLCSEKRPRIIITKNTWIAYLRKICSEMTITLRKNST